MWPLAIPPGQITAAQAMALAESLRDRKAEAKPSGKSGLRNQRRMPKELLRELAQANNSLDGSR